VHLRQTWHPIFQMNYGTDLALWRSGRFFIGSIFRGSSDQRSRSSENCIFLSGPLGRDPFFAWSDYASGRREGRSHCAANPIAKRWEVSLETGCIFGLGNPNNYVIAPQFLNLAWQPFPQWAGWAGAFQGSNSRHLRGGSFRPPTGKLFLGGRAAVSLRLCARRFAMVLLCGWRRGHGGCGQ
jgi:hypothetical protein